jgi:hypothetical protein
VEGFGGVIEMHEPTAFQLTATAAIIVFFVSMIVFIYAAIWWQSMIFGEMAGASIIFVIFFVELLLLSVENENPGEE